MVATWRLWASGPRHSTAEFSAGVPPVPAWEALADGALVAHARRGEPDAYGELVRRYQQRLYSVAFRLVGEEQEALDVTQEGLVRAYHALDRFDASRPFGPWAARIVTNLALNRLKARQRHPTMSLTLDGDDEGRERVLPDISREPEGQLLRAERTAALYAAIAALPPHYRAVIELRHFQEMAYDEIAATLGLPLSDVKSHLFRARRALRRLLEESR